MEFPDMVVKLKTVAEMGGKAGYLRGQVVDVAGPRDPPQVV
jgi:hypothetical protein